MRRGDVYWNDRSEQARGNKPGFYVVVGRSFARNFPLLQTVTCAPIYSEVLGIDTEVVVDVDVGVRHRSSVRCDLLMQVDKQRLTRRVGRLAADQVAQLNQAIVRGTALDESYDDA